MCLVGGPWIDWIWIHRVDILLDIPSYRIRIIDSSVVSRQSTVDSRHGTIWRNRSSQSIIILIIQSQNYYYWDLELLLLRRFNKPSTYSNRPPSDHSDVIPFPSSLTTLDSLPFPVWDGYSLGFKAHCVALARAILDIPASRSKFPFPSLFLISH